MRGRWWGWWGRGRGGGRWAGRGVALVVVEQVAGRERPYENLGVLDGRSGQVVHGDRLAGVADEALLARHLHLPQHGLQRVGPDWELVPKGTVPRGWSSPWPTG